MKRSRACEDLLALETQKRNRTLDVLTRSPSAEEELSRLLEAHAVLQMSSHNYPMDYLPTFDDLTLDDARLLDDMTDCLRLRGPHRSDTRAISLREREARDAQHALAFKRSPKIDDLFTQHSPDTTDHVFPDCFFEPRRRRRSGETPVFDMSAFRQVLEPQGV